MVPVPMVFKVLLLAVMHRLCEAPEVPMEAPPVILDGKSGLVVLGEVSERSGLLCKIGVFVR